MTAARAIAPPPRWQVALMTAAIAPIVVAVMLACAVEFLWKGSPK